MRYVSIAAAVLLAVVISGCRSGGAGEGEPLKIDELEGDFALSQRFEDGVRVEDAVFDPVQFQYDSYQIEDAEIPRIEQVAAYLKAHPGYRLVVEGHCDERGSRDYNVALGEHRALAVRAYLITLGVDSKRIQTRSYGEERPVDPGHSEDAWRHNRRGEFAVYR